MALEYDKNGNILSLDRNGLNPSEASAASGVSSLKMDELTYVYEEAGSASGATRVTNRLLYVQDAVDAGAYDEDIDNHENSGAVVGVDNRKIYNYDYDEIGNLTQDLAEGITDIRWNVANKVRKVVKDNGPDLEFGYGADGNRLKKEVLYASTGSTAEDEIIKKTYYIRDASGNVMATYEVKVSEGAPESGRDPDFSEKMFIEEHNLYGSSMLGQYEHSDRLITDICYDGELNSSTGKIENITNRDVFTIVGGEDVSPDVFLKEQDGTVGRRRYQLSNHLGNVLVVVSDRKEQVGNSNIGVTSYSADVKSATDYYPFGMQMIGRSFSSGSYRYGFNGHEIDDEVYGEGNFMDMGMRCYDARLGRMFQVDPRAGEYGWQTTYAYHRNSPILRVDYLGGGDNDDGTYTVEKDQTFSGIAKELGDDVDVGVLMRINGFTEATAHTLQAGQKINLPNPAQNKGGSSGAGVVMSPIYFRPNIIQQSSLQFSSLTASNNASSMFTLGGVRSLEGPQGAFVKDGFFKGSGYEVEAGHISGELSGVADGNQVMGDIQGKTYWGRGLVRGKMGNETANLALTGEGELFTASSRFNFTMAPSPDNNVIGFKFLGEAQADAAKGKITEDVKISGLNIQTKAGVCALCFKFGLGAAALYTKDSNELLIEAKGKGALLFGLEAKGKIVLQLDEIVEDYNALREAAINLFE